MEELTIYEIFDKKTNKTLEIKKFSTPLQVRAFQFYFAQQCDTKKYGIRMVIL